MENTGTLSAVLRPASSLGDDTALELAVGEEIIEVRVDRQGIHFRHPGGSAAEGLLPWDVAIAMSILPEAVRRAVSRDAA